MGVELFSDTSIVFGSVIYFSRERENLWKKMKFGWRGRLL